MTVRALPPRQPAHRNIALDGLFTGGLHRGSESGSGRRDSRHPAGGRGLPVSEPVARIMVRAALDSVLECA